MDDYTAGPPGPLYCVVCNHSGPISCIGCGGRGGSSTFGPCNKCAGKVVSESTPEQVKQYQTGESGLHPQQFDEPTIGPCEDERVNQIIDCAGPTGPIPGE